MLTRIIVSLIAILAFAIFEYVHNKATYSLKTAWYKYAGAFILGTFGFSYLTQWKYFQWLEQGAFIVAFLFFFWIIVQKLNIKGIPGQSSTKIIIAIICIGLLTSCARYDNAIHGTTVTPGAWVPTYDSTGLKVVGTHQAQDTTYLISPTWTQAWKWAGERNDRIWFWLGLIILALAIGIFIYFNNKGTAGPGSVIPLVIAILVGGIMTGGSLEWEKYGMEKEITKARYDSLMQNPGNLGPFWDTIRVK